MARLLLPYLAEVMAVEAELLQNLLSSVVVREEQEAVRRYSYLVRVLEALVSHSVAVKEVEVEVPNPL